MSQLQVLREPFLQALVNRPTNLQAEISHALAIASDEASERAFLVGIAFPVEAAPVVSIILPVCGLIRLTRRCLLAIRESVSGLPYEIIVVDDASPDDTARVLAQISGIRLLTNETNLGFVGSCNRGALAARGEYLVFLNNDTVVLPGWLQELRQTFVDHDHAGLVGSMLLDPDGRLQEAGGIIWSDASGWNYGRRQDPENPAYNFMRDVDYCSGASIMIPKSLWEALAGFDEVFSPGYYEDTDLAFRIAAAGRRVLYQPLSRVIHFEGMTAGRDLSEGMKQHQVRNRETFRRRWGIRLRSHGSSRDLPDLPVHDRLPQGRVLVIDACTPTPDLDSGSNDTCMHLELLQELGFRVSFLPLTNPFYWERYTRALQRQGVECLYYPFVSSLREYLGANGSRFDWFLVYRLEAARIAIPAIRSLLPAARIVYDTVDLHFLRLARGAGHGHGPIVADQHEQMKAVELEMMRQANLTVVVSDYEQKLLQELVPEVRVCHLPICRRDIPGSRAAFGERRDLVFVGGFQHPPNLDAVSYFIREIWEAIAADLPDCRFLVVGSKVPPSLRALESERIRIVGYVPDLQEVLDGCRLTVAPLRWGAGVKGKVIQSLCYGVPCIGTPLAFEGAGLEVGRHVLAGDTAAAFAQHCVAAYRDQDLWQRLSDQGLEFVRAHYSRPALRTRLEQMLGDLGLDLLPDLRPPAGDLT